MTTTPRAVPAENNTSILTEIIRLVRSHQIIMYQVDRYLRTAHRDKVLGNLWTLLDPLLMMLVLFFVFHHVRKASIIFTLYLFAGLLAWDIFSKSITGCTGCLRASKHIAHKFPVPLAVFPVAIVVQKVYDALWGLLAYIVIFIGVRVLSDDPLPIDWRVLLLPIWLFFFLLLTLGFGLIVARVGVLFRDMTDIVAVLLRMGFFANPIFITVQEHIPAHLHRQYFLLNPIAGYLTYLRVILPGGEVLIDHYQIPVPYYPLYICVAAILIFTVGLWIFIRGQRHYTKYM